MKLCYGTTSPSIRKVTVLAHEVGLHAQIERVDTLPWATDPTVGKVNPIGKVPTLVLDDGATIYDSNVIVDFLDRTHTGPRRLPEVAPKWPPRLTARGAS